LEAGAEGGGYSEVSGVLSGDCGDGDEAAGEVKLKGEFADDGGEEAEALGHYLRANAFAG
jgi:hypothetical protein